MAGDPTAYQPSSAEGRERLVTVGHQPADAGAARAWLAQLDREAADIRAQRAAPARDNDWRRRAGRALAVKAAEIARLEGWLLRHAPAVLGMLADEAGTRLVTPADLDRAEQYSHARVDGRTACQPTRQALWWRYARAVLGKLASLGR